MDQCSEYAGRATATGQRAQCQRDATWHARFMDEWVTLCGIHVKEYYDLPHHRLNDRVLCIGTVHA
jgi:hypothetical protein